MIIQLLLFGFCSLFLNPLWSATQGSWGEKSIGTINVSADFAGTALINNLSDMVFTSVNPAVSLTNQENVCVYSNSLLGGSYSITATGSGAGNAFTVSNGVSTVAYTVSWAATTNATSGTALTSNVPLAGLNTGILTSVCLLGITNSTLFVNFSTQNLQNAAAGTFTGVLTLLITPA